MYRRTLKASPCGCPWASTGVHYFAPLIEDPRASLILETTHKRKNGVDVPVEIFVQYIAPAGMQGRFFSIVRNISKRLLEEKEKEQMQAKMLHTQKLESVGELAAGIAHEINTPIQYIGTNLSFLEEAFADVTTLIEQYHNLMEAVKQRKNTDHLVAEMEACQEDIDLDYLIQDFPQAIHQTNDGVKRVSKLVGAMKDFSHPGSKDKEPTNINKIIETTVQIARNEGSIAAMSNWLLPTTCRRCIATPAILARWCCTCCSMPPIPSRNGSNKPPTRPRG